MALKPALFLTLFLLCFLAFLGTADAVTVNFVYGVYDDGNLLVVIAPIPKIIIADNMAPIVGTIFLENFITANGFIDGTGYFHALVYDGGGIAGCEYKIFDAWQAGNFDGSYCTSNSITIQDGSPYSFNIRATDNYGNMGTGIDRNYTGKAALVDSQGILDEDFINIGLSLVVNVMIGLGILAMLLILAVLTSRILRH